MTYVFRKLAFGLGIAVGVTGLMPLQSKTALADDKAKAVVELFTSQGCSSCPPADELLGKLAKRDDVIALTFPVDYWDYLGWKDTLASPAFSARQRAYARARRDGQVYTPQMVVDGAYHAVGSHSNAVKQTILKSLAATKNSRVPMKIWTEGDSIVITAGDAAPGMRVKPATVWLALVKEAETVKIERGENRGETITYYNVVRELTPVGQWNGKAVTIKLPKHHLMSRGSDSCTVLLQQDTAGPVIAAAQMERW